PPVSARANGIPRAQLQAKISQGQAQAQASNPPLAPLDVHATSLGTAAFVAWSLADQGGNRPANSFAVEHRSPPGEARPWINAGSAPGPGGVQTRDTKMNYETRVAIERGREYEFHVCTVNRAGRVCSQPVPVVEGHLGSSTQMQQIPRTSSAPPCRS